MSVTESYISGGRVFTSALSHRSFTTVCACNFSSHTEEAIFWRLDKTAAYNDEHQPDAAFNIQHRNTDYPDYKFASYTHFTQMFPVFMLS